MARKNALQKATGAVEVQTGSEAPTLSRSRSLNDIVEMLHKRGCHVSIVDECLRSPYIEYGYRKTKSIRDTFYTLFSFHNETMNIWSHLIGFFCVLVAGYHVISEMVDKDEHHIFEIIAFEAFIFCAALCLLMSAIYHWFGCISEAYHNCLLRMDVTGIGLLVSGSFIPAVYYGMLRCNIILPDLTITCGETFVLFMRQAFTVHPRHK